MYYWSVWFSYEQISVNMLHCGEYGAYVLPRVLALLHQDQHLAIFVPGHTCESCPDEMTIMVATIGINFKGYRG